MSFSFYFDTIMGREVKNIWVMSSANNVEWVMEEEWTMSSNQDAYGHSKRKPACQKFTLQSEEIADYKVMVVVFRSDSKEESIFKYQDLSKSKVISILYEEYFLNFSNKRSKNFRCVINLFPRSSLANAWEPVFLKETTASKDVAIPKTEKTLDKLTCDMRNLLENGLCSDVVLIAGEQKIKAHKCILSARSEVFAKMFSSPMKENFENEVNISDIEGPVLLEMIHYMYSGKILLEDALVVRGVYVAADKYAFDELKALCSSWLKYVTNDNVLDTLILADTFTDEELKNEAMRFISKNILQLKLQSTWHTFRKEQPSLTIEILEYVIENPQS